ncbi:MAG TPA: hypothetical protein VME43_29590 [Bryobacteraceae bacterium]|nr:hypothetical protein [Bryobacteraceae bacterium]
METQISGFYRTRAEGEAARNALLTAGYLPGEVSLLTGDTRGHETPAVGPVAATGTLSEAPRDAWIGGVAGLAAGAIAMVLPGIGPLIAMGPLAGAIGGMGVGAAAGGFIGLLRDQGLSHEEAEFYAEGVKRGGALVTVHDVSGDRATEARKILDRQKAIEVEKLTPDAEE